MKNNIIFFIVLICMFSSCHKNNITIEEILEYQYDFTSGRALSLQFESMGFKPTANFDEDMDMDIGFIDIHIIGVPQIVEKTGELGGSLIILSFYSASQPVPSERNKNRIINLLVEHYGEGSYVSFTEQELPIWDSPVVVPNLPVKRWELPDRYLYLNDYNRSELMQRYEYYKNNKEWQDFLAVTNGGYYSDHDFEGTFEIRIKMKE